ncbi:hypothetical protein HMN09_00007500 [Mycena chlorophos]|uniref:Uncharacterized protein n=1 Tax=Mycena chlorophos TaxID=658473 RepID=A0A8H6WRW8_MYCCL|nr:hypothetical protein HMN09_00007500 [Mycena chlorophos]
MSATKRAALLKRPSLATSISAPPRTGRAKRPLSENSQNSDDPSEFTSLSDSAPSLRRGTSPLDASEVCVFVALNLDGTAEEDTSEGGEKIWWPALRVPTSANEFKIYGAIGASKRGTVVVAWPGDVQSATKANGEIRFPQPEYVYSPGPSPRKRQKLDKTALEAAWMEAVAVLVRDINDGLPSPEFQKSVRHIPKRASPDDEDDPLSDLSDAEPWTPPPADDMLRIPGELVLGKEKKNSRIFWYAKVVEYVPPQTPKQLPLYKVLWMDGGEASIERSWFFSCEEDEFGTVTVGKFESQYDEDTADEEVSKEDEDFFEQRLRDVSPEPQANPLPDGPTFSELDPRDQFVYTKPVLRAILRDEYPPAKETHDLFIAGGKKRDVVVKRAGEHGMMNPTDVTLFRRFLEEWVLRGLATQRIVRSPSPPATIIGNPPSSPAPIPPNSSLPSIQAVPSSPIPASQPPLSSAPPSAASSLASIDEADPPKQARRTISQCFRDDKSIDIELEESHVRTKLAGGDDISSPTTLLLPTQLSVSSSSKSPRQEGCEAYERLSIIEKYDYCLNVLLPELLIQIYAWREGKRPALQLLDDATERKVHSFGAVEKAKRDWVFDAVRLRRKKEEELRRGSLKGELGGTRPRRMVGRR